MQARPGFTLIEVLVAICILVMALASTAFLLAGGFSTYRRQGQQMELFHVGHDKLETISGTPYTKLKAELEAARQPTDPFRPTLPADHDFVKRAAGSADVRYVMDPAGPDSDVYVVAPYNPTIMGDNAVRPHGRIEATLKLQYWDPGFDAPSMTDRGLIRANLSITGDTGAETATKYVAR